MKKEILMALPAFLFMLLLTVYDGASNQVETEPLQKKIWKVG